MIELKIGRRIYQITDESLFMDNGCCVQLITNHCDHCGGSDWAVLSKRAVKEIAAFERVTVDELCFTLKGA